MIRAFWDLAKILAQSQTLYSMIYEFVISASFVYDHKEWLWLFSLNQVNRTYLYLLFFFFKKRAYCTRTINKWKCVICFHCYQSQRVMCLRVYCVNACDAQFACLDFSRYCFFSYFSLFLNIFNALTSKVLARTESCVLFALLAW